MQHHPPFLFIFDDDCFLSLTGCRKMMNFCHEKPGFAFNFSLTFPPHLFFYEEENEVFPFVLIIN